MSAELLLEIQSRSHPYAVREEPTFGAALKRVAAPDAFWILDAKVAEIYADEIAAVVPAARKIEIEASEDAKSYARLGAVFETILDAGFRRNQKINVVGGGVLQDIGCFVASVLMRGVKWSLLPTTLLAQCDSCIGSKSSLNVGRFKNQLGTWYPPHEVVLCFDVLKSLPPDDLRSGLGEAIKLHLIAGGGSTERLRENLSQMGRDEAALARLVLDSLRIKQKFIENDEFDQGERRLLNYGHTFAHAFESATNYAIPHGIAVTLGILSATFFSARLGWTKTEHFEALKRELEPFYAPFEEKLAQIAPEKILAAMKLDKKNTSEGLTFVLTHGPGQMELHTLPRDHAQALLSEVLEMWRAKP